MGTALGLLGSSEWEAWTAGFRLDDKIVAAKVFEVYLDFLDAGVDILTANTYNISGTFLREVLKLSESGNRDRGPPEIGAHHIADAEVFAARCIQQNIDQARRAIDEFMAESPSAAQRPLLAASMGCYGTCIPGRGETANRESGNPNRVPGYGVDQVVLEEFHRKRVEAVLDTKSARDTKTKNSTHPVVDILAFETIPDLVEAKAILNVLEETLGDRDDLKDVAVWITFTCPNENQVDNGDNFTSCVEAVVQSEVITGVGVNCTAPHLIVPLLRTAREVIDKTAANKNGAHDLSERKLLVCYPNSGERYIARALKDGEDERWTRDDHAHMESFADMALQWHAEGCSVIGGCCRVTSTDIRAISDRFPPR